MFNFSFYSNHNQTRPERVTTLTEFVTAIRTGANGLAETIKQARENYLTDGKKGAYSLIKNTLPVVAPCLFDGKAKASENITDYYGAFWLDLDGLTPQQAVEKRDLLGKDPYIMAAFLSPSGHGVKALVRTDNTDVKNHARIFEKIIQPYYESLTNCPVDQSGKNANRLCFLSFDPQIIAKPNAEIFNVKLNDDEKEATHEPQNGRYTIDTEQLNTVWQRVKKHHQIEFTTGNRHALILYFAVWAKQYGALKNDVLAFVKDLCTQHKADFQHHQRTVNDIYKDAKYPFGNWKSYDAKTDVTRLEVKQFCGEKTDEIYHYIQNHDRILIIAPTGSGKSTALLQIAERITNQAERGKTVLFITPNRITAENLYHQNKQNYPNLILAVGGSGWKSEIEARDYEPSVIIGVPELVQDISNICDVMLIIQDEIHTAETATEYRNAFNHISESIHRGVKFVGVTATPTPYIDRILTNVLEVNVTKKTRYFPTLIINYNGIHTIAEQADKAVKDGKKVIIRMFTKAKLNALGELLQNQYQRTVTRIHSGNKHTTPHIQLAQEGGFDTDILICTQILEDGFSLNEDQQIEVIFEYDPREKGVLPQRAVQFAARPRKQKKTNVTIYYRPKERDAKTNVPQIAKNHLKAEQYYTEHLAQALPQPNIDGTPNTLISTSCNTNVKRFTKNGNVNIFAQLRICTEKYYYQRRMNGLLLEDLENAFGEKVQIGNPDFIPNDSKITDGQKRIKNERAKIRQNTAQIWELCKDEENAIKVGCAVGKDKKLSWYNDRTLTTRQALDNLADKGISEERLINSYVLASLRRLELLRGLGLNHHDAYRLVSNNENGYQWNILLTRMTAVRHHENTLNSDDRARLADLEKDLQAVALIREYYQKNGRFTLEQLKSYLASLDGNEARPLFEHWHHATDEKLTMLLKGWFVCKKDKRGTDNRQYWLLTDEMNRETFTDLYDLTPYAVERLFAVKSKYIEHTIKSDLAEKTESGGKAPVLVPTNRPAPVKTPDRADLDDPPAFLRYF